MNPSAAQKKNNNKKIIFLLEQKFRLLPFFNPSVIFVSSKFSPQVKQCMQQRTAYLNFLLHSEQLTETRPICEI